MKETLSPKAVAYLDRLEAWAKSETKAAKLQRYWTPQRRKEWRLKVADQWTDEKRREASNRSKGYGRANWNGKGIKRLVPNLPGETTVWRSMHSRQAYHLRRDCPIGKGDLKKGRLAATKLSGRQLCALESYRWRKMGGGA